MLPYLLIYNLYAINIIRMPTIATQHIYQYINTYKLYIESHILSHLSFSYIIFDFQYIGSFIEYRLQSSSPNDPAILLFAFPGFRFQVQYVQQLQYFLCCPCHLCRRLPIYLFLQFFCFFQLFQCFSELLSLY